MTPSPFDSLLITIVLATLAVGLPIFFVLAIRALWDRKLQLSRSKELEKLIWQLHRIASAMEHQMNLSFPAIQPGTEEAADLAFLQQTAAPRPAPARSAATPAAAAPAAAPSPAQPAPAPQPATPQPAASQASAPAPQPAPATPAPAETQEPALPPLVIRQPSDEPPRNAGVNSMFGF